MKKIKIKYIIRYVWKTLHTRQRQIVNSVIVKGVFMPSPDFDWLNNCFELLKLKFYRVTCRKLGLRWFHW